MKAYQLHNALREAGLVREEHDQHWNVLGSEYANKLEAITEELPAYSEWDVTYADEQGYQRGKQEADERYDAGFEKGKKEGYQNGYEDGRNTRLSVNTPGVRP